MGVQADLQEATIRAVAIAPGDMVTVAAWMLKWSDSLPRCRKSSIAGSIDIYNVVAPRKALDELPDYLYTEVNCHSGERYFG